MWIFEFFFKARIFANESFERISDMLLGFLYPVEGEFNILAPLKIRF